MTSTVNPPPYYENHGFQTENYYSARPQVGANPYPQYFSTNVPSVPTYIPRVSTHQSSIPVAPPSSSSRMCSSSIKKIVIITQFPNLFPEKEDSEAEAFDDFRKKFMEKEQQSQKGDPRRGGVPDWFGL